MVDVFSKAKRSEVMSRIRSRGNKSTEMAFRDLLRRNGITGWRRHYGIIGTPDFAFPSDRVAVFLDGAFWHGHPASALPATNTEFWRDKIQANRRRDRKVTRTLRSSGWSVLRIWDVDLKRDPDRCLARLRRVVASRRKRREIC